MSFFFSARRRNRDTRGELQESLNISIALLGVE